MNENELNVFNENVNAHKEVIVTGMNAEKEKVNSLLSTPNETEIMPLYNYLLCAPFDKNPFNTIDSRFLGRFIIGSPKCLLIEPTPQNFSTISTSLLLLNTIRWTLLPCL